MRFHEAMAAIAREALTEEHAACLLMARALETRLLSSSNVDPAELGWARYYQVRSLYFLSRYAEALELLSRPTRDDISFRADNAAWMRSAEAEMAAVLGDTGRAERCAHDAIRARLAEQDLPGARAALETARALFLRAEEPDRVEGLLDLLDRLLDEAPPGSDEAERLASLILDVERTDWGRAERRRGRRGLGLALCAAAERGDLLHARELLAAGADPDALDGARPGLCRPLLGAAFIGELSLVRMLLAAGARPDRPNVQGRTPLHHAADQGHAEVAALLVAAGAPLEAEDLFGQTALHLASWQDHADALRVLLQAGANPDARDATGCTPLHLTASEPLPELLRALLEAGASVDAQDQAGCTPLMHAAAEGCASCVEVLLEAGARSELMDEEGRVAADFAFANGHLLLGRRLSGGPRLLLRPTRRRTAS